MSRKRSFILDPIPVPQSSPEIARPPSRGAGSSKCGLPAITQGPRLKRSSSALTNSMRSTQDKVPNIVVTSKDSHDITTPVNSRNTSNPLYSSTPASSSLRRRVAHCVQGVDLLVTSPNASAIETDPGLQPESIPVVNNSVKEVKNEVSLDVPALTLETTPGIPILDQLTGVTTVPFKDESVNSTRSCDDDNSSDENHDEMRKYSVQQASYGPTESEAGYVPRKACYLSLEKATTKDSNTTSIGQILAESIAEKKNTIQIESYFTKQIAPPIYKTHRPAERKVKPLTPQLIIDKDGMAVDNGKQGGHSIKMLERQILIRTSPPFKRLVQTPYGDFITKFECPSFNVTRYSTLSRLRWMSYQISHFDNNLNPDQKMQPAIPNIFCFQSEIYRVLKEKLSTSDPNGSKKFVFSTEELKSILNGFESYYKEFDSLPKPIVIPQEYAQVCDNSSTDKYGDNKALMFDQTLFQDDKFRYHVDLLGDQFGFNALRCPAPIEELLHNEDLAIADADKTTESIERTRIALSTESCEKPKPDKHMAALIREHHKIDLFNPKLITSSDTYTIMDTRCKIEASLEAGYLRLDSSIAGSPLPEGSVSISQLMEHGISIVEVERSTATSIYRSGSVFSSIRAS